jgi:hypothetical protein
MLETRESRNGLVIYHAFRAIEGWSVAIMVREHRLPLQLQSIRAIMDIGNGAFLSDPYIAI